MASARFQRPVRLRREDETLEGPSIASEQEEPSSTSGDDDGHAPLNVSDGAISESEPGSHDENSGGPSEGESEDLKDISFGALAKAQAALAPITRKRKFQESVVAPDNNLVPRRNSEKPEYEESSPVKPKKITTAPGRTSKHAPAVQSSRHAVSRRRDIFDPPASLKSRDPRFDPTVIASNTDASAVEKANKNYSFLTSYRASEILDLKAQIKKSKDPDVIAALKRQVMSLDSKIRAAEAQQRERDIVRRHKQKEKEAIKSGQKSKPYFLKRSDIKKEALAEKFESMGKKARDKAMERKRKRLKAKESRGMPRFRRERVPGENVN